MLISISLALCGDVHSNPGLVTFGIYHVNIRTLIGNKAQLEAEISVDQFHVVALTETRLDDNISDDDIKLTGFQSPFGKDRDRLGGGVAAYIRSNIAAVRLIDLDHPGIEALWIETAVPKQTLLIGIIYRPPNAPVVFWNTLYDIVENTNTVDH